jgi:hypothetical protein
LLLLRWILLMLLLLLLLLLLHRFEGGWCSVFIAEADLPTKFFLRSFALVGTFKLMTLSLVIIKVQLIIGLAFRTIMLHDIVTKPLFDSKYRFIYITYNWLVSGIINVGLVQLYPY